MLIYLICPSGTFLPKEVFLLKVFPTLIGNQNNERYILYLWFFFSMNLQKYNQANALFPEMQMTRKIFTRAAANLFF